MARHRRPPSAILNYENRRKRRFRKEREGKRARSSQLFDSKMGRKKKENKLARRKIIRSSTSFVERNEHISAIEFEDSGFVERRFYPRPRITVSS